MKVKLTNNNLVEGDIVTISFGRSTNVGVFRGIGRTGKKSFTYICYQRDETFDDIISKPPKLAKLHFRKSWVSEPYPENPRVLLAHRGQFTTEMWYKVQRRRDALVNIGLITNKDFNN